MTSHMPQYLTKQRIIVDEFDRSCGGRTAEKDYIPSGNDQH